MEATLRTPKRKRQFEMTRERRDAVSEKTGKLSECRSSALKPRPERGVGQGTFCMPLAGGSLGVFGSTPCFSGTSAMPNRVPIGDCNANRLPLPMDEATWEIIIDQLGLSPQQTRIVELILRGQQDKHIAAELNLSASTVRTYLTRIFIRTDVTDRVGLVLRVFAMAQEIIR